MIRLIIEFRCIQNQSFLWLHPSFAFVYSMDYTSRCWGTEEGSTQSMLSPNCYFTDAGSKLDLCLFLLDGCHRTFQDYSKRELPSLSFFETIKKAFFSPKRQILGGREGMRRRFFSFHSCSLTAGLGKIYLMCLLFSALLFPSLLCPSNHQ